MEGIPRWPERAGVLPPAGVVKPHQRVEVGRQALRVVDQPVAQVVGARELALPPARLLAEVAGARAEELLPVAALGYERGAGLLVQHWPAEQSGPPLLTWEAVGDHRLPSG